MLKITVITVVRNNKSCMDDCINSVLSQTYRDVEYIIIDGGSTDGTVNIIRKYEKYIAVWMSEPDHGIYDAMNKGILLATGDVVGILNADDFYSNCNVLSRVRQVFVDKDMASCYGDLEYVDACDLSRVVRIWHSGSYSDKVFFKGWMPPHPTFFVRREIYQKYGTFNPALGTSADYEMMLRLLVKHRISTTYIPEILVKMRTGGQSNASFNNRIKANRMDRLAWNINGLKPDLLTLWIKPIRKIIQFWPSLVRSMDYHGW